MRKLIVVLTCLAVYLGNACSLYAQGGLEEQKAQPEQKQGIEQSEKPVVPKTEKETALDKPQLLIQNKEIKVVIDKMMVTMSKIKSVELNETNKQETRTWKGVIGVRTSNIRKVIKSNTDLGVEYVQAFIGFSRKALLQYEHFSKIGKAYHLVRMPGNPEWTIQANTIFVGQPSSEKVKLIFDSMISPKFKEKEKISGADCLVIESALNPKRILSSVIPGVNMDVARALMYTFTIWIGETDNRLYKTSIKIESGKKVDEDKKQADKKAFLGVNLGGELPEGVEVASVNSDSAAEKAGIQDGDIIISVDGEKTDSMKKLVELISAHKPGDEVNLRILRGGEEIELKVKLGARDSLDVVEMEINFINETETTYFNFNENTEFEIPDEVKIKFGMLPYLGVYVEPYNGDVKGMIIGMVVKNSPAAKHGLKKGDIIAEIDGKQVFTSDEFQNAIKQHKINEEISLRIITGDGKLEERKVILGTFPEPNFKQRYNIIIDQQEQQEKTKE